MGLLLLTIVISVTAYVILRSMGLFRTPVYETDAATVPALSRPAILVFSKTNGYIHAEAIPAAQTLLREIGSRRGWAIYLSDSGAVHSPESLARFDVVVWNNVTGDVLTPAQRTALRAWVENGGRWVGLHATGSGADMAWDWQRDELIGTRYMQHTLWPVQPIANLVFERKDHPSMSGMPDRMPWKDELYSFSPSPRPRVQVLARLDESSYMDGQPAWFRRWIEQGEDHPIVWWRPVGDGVSFYSALGHSGEAYQRPEYRRLIENVLSWLIAKPAGELWTKDAAK